MNNLFGLKYDQTYIAYDAQKRIEEPVVVTSITKDYAILKFRNRHYVHLTPQSDVQVKGKHIIFN